MEGDPKSVDVTLVINGRRYREPVDSRQLLVEFIRVNAGLTGTHVGCDTSYCGACTVLLDRRSVRSCSMFTVQAAGSTVETVESLESEQGLHPLQVAFAEHHALQCGFCTPGFLMSAVQLLKDNSDPSDEEIRNGLAGNVCRCTGYLNIIAAVRAAGVKFRAEHST